MELGLYRYQTEDLSLAKAAQVAGLSFDSFKALQVQRRIQPRLGPVDEQDARQEIAALDRMLPESAAR
ncbi:MAG TPA: UPF0175 family protein [Anaerolineae bacterium]|nr:UPF0175 family protein [Anaerolineae bacterium]